MINKNISILIVDDNPGFVKRMKVLLDELDNVESIHSAGDYDEAVSQLDRNKQDTILLDINLPGKSGISLLKKIKEGGAVCKVIMLSNHSEDYYKEQCKKLGATHFLDKTTEFDQVPSILANVSLKLPYILS
ncbi:MAG: response regulator [Chitinophagaceae bacterium]